MSSKIIKFLLLVLPLFVLLPFFISSKFILLDDHEIYRLHFDDLNMISAMRDDWFDMNRFRPGYWLIRQTQSEIFGLSTYGWYFSSFVFLLISLVSLYFVFRLLGLDFLLSAVLSWYAFLDKDSINSWLALGPQEGIALCFLSLSLLFFIKSFFKVRYEKLFWQFLAFIFSIFSSLVKESFLLSVFLLLSLNNFFQLKKNTLFVKRYLFWFVSIPVFLLSIYLVKYLQINDFTISSISNNQFINFVKFLFSSWNVRFLMVSIFLVGIFKRKNTIKYWKKINEDEILIIFFLMFFQILIYSFRDYIAPHYIQPFLFTLVLLIAFLLSKLSKKEQFKVSLFLFFLFPISFFYTVLAVNNYNFFSNKIKNIEQIILNSKIKNIWIVGPRSDDYEAIYSLRTRLEFLNPSFRWGFFDPDEMNQFSISKQDVGELFLDNLPGYGESLVLGFSKTGLENLGEEIYLDTKSLLRVNTNETFYTSYPYFFWKCSSENCIDNIYKNFYKEQNY